MSLPAREQQVLDGIETALQDGAAGLTSMFVLFTRLAADKEKPRVEELGLPSRRSPLPREADGLPADARLRSLARGRRGQGGSGERLRVVILLTMLVAPSGALWS